nr:MAG TPA: hypothetical protein [Caudoviricetes sp.]
MTTLIHLVNYVMATIGGFFEMLWIAIAYKYRVITILLLVCLYFYAMYQVFT